MQQSQTPEEIRKYWREQKREYRKKLKAKKPKLKKLTEETSK